MQYATSSQSSASAIDRTRGGGAKAMARDYADTCPWRPPFCKSAGRMQATTTEEVVSRLEAIIEESIEKRSRMGYFAALYNRVTQHVRQGIAAGNFADGPRMERFDVVFANRYLDAYDRYRAGEPPTASWLAAFRAAEDDDLSVLQHLALAMNAHIDLDLGIAAARVAPGTDYGSLRVDFDRINDVLASLVPLEESQAGAIAPVVGKLVKAASRITQAAIDVGIAAARLGAWHFGSELSPLTPGAQAHLIARRDVEVAVAGDLLLEHQPVITLLAIGECRDVRKNIETLAAGEFELPPIG
jgi:hypothetical protein